MKNLFIALFFVLSFSIGHSQTAKKMVRVDGYKAERERLDSFKDEAEPKKIDTITTDVRVTQIIGDKAWILTSNGKRFEIPVEPELNPFKYVLQTERVYRMRIYFDNELRYEKHSRGQLGTVPAKVIFFTVAFDQMKRDWNYYEDLIEPGYDRSPRY